MNTLGILIVSGLVLLGNIVVIRGQECDSISYTLIANPRRSTKAVYDYKVDIPLCDDGLNGAMWYRFLSYAGERIVERAANDPVPIRRCGTEAPIYIRGLNSHPTENSTTLNATVCANFGGKPCILMETIQIHRCPAQGTQNVYFLYKLKAPPGCSLSYCVGEKPPCNQGEYWTGNSCVNYFPTMSGFPLFGGPYTKGSGLTEEVYFTCRVQYKRRSNDTNARFRVTFLFNGRTMERVNVMNGSTGRFEDLPSFYLTAANSSTPVVLGENYLRGRLGREICCKAESYWDGYEPVNEPTNSTMLSQTKFYAALESEYSRYILDASQGSTYTIAFRSTIPLTCRHCSDTDCCYYDFRMRSEAATSTCNMRWISNYTALAQVYILPSLSQSQQSYGMTFEPYRDDFISGSSSLWRDYLIPPVMVEAVSPSTSYLYCSSVTDPNIYTFDNAELFVNPNGSLYQEGDLLKNPKLATTLRAIAADPFTFYNGSLASDIVEDLREYGSIITLEDLQNYTSLIKTPVNVSLHNGQFRLFNPPPPSSGSVLSFIVNILDGYNFSPASVADTNSKVLTYHRIIEAFKFAYAKRSQLGDEDFVNVTDLVANLTSDKYAEEIRLQIDDNVTHDFQYYGPTFDVKPEAGTAHLNILGPDGAAVSLTSSLNLQFGSKCRGRRTGIIFNNDMDDFSTPGTRNHFGVPASPSNYIVPGKRPMSSMSPTIVLDENGSTVFVSGASGGTNITTATAFVAMNSLWFDSNLGNATDTARVHHQLIPNEVDAELWLEQKILEGLEAKNHTVIRSPKFAVVGSIRNRCSSVSSRDITCNEAVSDGRKGGSPDGYANQTETSTTTAVATVATTTSLKSISAANSVQCVGVSWLICSAGLLIRVHS